MFKLAVLLLTLAVADLAWCQVDPSAFCVSDCAMRRNGKDHYVNPGDCRSFVQCYFYNETYAIGYIRSCPTGLYFSEKALTCVVEGDVPCSDVCDDQEIAARGCAAVIGSCSAFIWCGTISHQLCCPAETRFNQDTCQCEEDLDLTCTDACSLPSFLEATSVSPPVVNGSFCVDSFGTFLSPSENPTEFILLDPEIGDSIQGCPVGTIFDLVRCSCSNFTEIDDASIFAAGSQAKLFLPFDGDALDYSVNKFSTFIYGNATFEGASLNSTGSLRFFDGHVEIPATKNFDMKWAASWCLKYRCGNNESCAGGLLSNKNAENGTYGIVVSSLNVNQARVQIELSNPNGLIQTDVSTVNDWNQICVVYDGSQRQGGTLRVYVNKELAISNEFSAGWIKISHCPYTIGHDQNSGFFNGNIDEVAVFGQPLSASDVEAHYEGQESMRASNLIP